MKYNAKKVLIIAAGMAVAGLLLSVGVKVVTKTTRIESNEKGALAWFSDRFEKDFDYRDNKSDEWKAEDSSQINKLQDEITKTFDASVQGIDLEVDIGNVVVKRNEKKETIVHVTPGAYQRVEISQEENEIHLEVSSQGDYVNKEGAFIEILVGKDIVLKDAEFDLKLGDLTMENIVLQDSDMVLSLGNFNFTGDFINHNKIESSLGDVNITLTGVKSDYRYNLQNDMGEIVIDGNEISDFMSAATQDGDGKNYIEVDCSLGNTTIKFK